MKSLILTLIITLPLTLWGQGWEQILGGSLRDIGYSVQQTTDGGYIITGSTYSFGNGNSDIYLIKTDGSGNEQWNQTYGGVEEDEGRSVQQTSDGGYIITGTKIFFPTDEDFDVILIKTDGSGNEQWEQTFGGPWEDMGFSVQQISDGGYIVTGFTSPSSGSNEYFNVYLIKTNQFGNITSTFEIPLLKTERKLEKTVNLIGQEIKPQTNTPIIEIFDDGSTQKKFIIEK